MTRCRIVILGAGGFIGRRLIGSLALDPQIQAVAAVRQARPPPFPPGVDIACLDATCVTDLQPVLAGAAGVVNCVAGSATAIVGAAEALRVAIDAMGGAAPRVVHLSSLAAYGTAEGLVDESAPLLGDLDAYSAAKVTAEHALKRVEKAVILRPGIVYGPGSPLWSLYLGRLLISGRIGNLGARGEGICNLVYIEDVIKAIQRSLVLAGIEGRVFNLASANSPTWNEYFRLYAVALGAPPVNSISALRLATETLLLAPVLKLAEKAAGSRAASLPPAIRPWLLARCAQAIRMQVSAAEDLLSMRWEPFDSGLAITAKWFRDPAGA
jgi:nucleoside-diphosphate-sugar epimerase